jgi:hypothetical protein
MSFTTAALAYRESIVVAEEYQATGDWKIVRDRVVGDNLLQMRTANASKRICQEVISRLRLLTSAQLEIVTGGARLEQNYLLWLAICKRYRFIYDFAADVLREKYLRLNLVLTADDFNAFFNIKAEWHPEVDRLSSASRNQLRQYIYRTLREAELLSKEGTILPAFMTPRLALAINEDNPAHFTIYPISDFDIRGWNK